MTTDPYHSLAVRLAEQPEPDHRKVELMRQSLLAAVAAEEGRPEAAAIDAQEQAGRRRASTRQARARGRPVRRLAIVTFVAVVAVLTAAGGVYVSSRSSKPVGPPTDLATPAQIVAYLDALGGAVRLSASPDPTLPPGVIVDGRLLRPVLVDGGEMGLAPSAAGATPHFSLGRARALMRRAESGLMESAQVGSALLARVWIATDLTAGLPSYQGRLAWIGLASPVLTGISDFCFVAPLQIVVLDAATGHDVLDFTAWGPSGCPDHPILPNPRVTAADEEVSIPWTALGDVRNQQQPQYFNWKVRYTIPSCATVREDVSTPSPSRPTQVLGMLAKIPIDTPARCSSPRTVTTWFGPEWDPLSKVIHEPLGVTAPGL